jgi:hypothetical protein
VQVHDKPAVLCLALHVPLQRGDEAEIVKHGGT